MIALLIAGAFSMLYSLLLTPLFIRVFNRLRWGQPIRVDGPKEHEVKRGTPTMGGIIFLSGSSFFDFVTLISEFEICSLVSSEGERNEEKKRMREKRR